MRERGRKVDEDGPAFYRAPRHYGLLANRRKRPLLAQAREALQRPALPPPAPVESLEDFWLRVAGLDIHMCPTFRIGRSPSEGSLTRHTPSAIVIHTSAPLMSPHGVSFGLLGLRSTSRRSPR